MKKFMHILPISLVCASALIGGTVTVTLNQGWNAIGPNSETTLTDIKNQLGSKLLNIQSPDGTKTYNSSSTRTPSFIQFEVGTGYWVNVSSNTSITVVEKDFTSDQTIKLKSGWNLIDPLNDMVLDSVKQQLGSKLLNIQSPDGTKTYNSSSTRTPSFTNFLPTIGYWINLNADANLIFSFSGVGSSSMLSNDAVNGQLNKSSSTYKSYTVKLLSDAIAPSSPTSNISVYGSVNSIDIGDGLAINGSYPVGSKFQIVLMDASGAVVATSTPVTLTSSMVSDSFFYVDNISVTESTTSAATTGYSQATDMYGIDSTYDLTIAGVSYKVKTFVSGSKTGTATTNVPVTGNINGVNTGASLNISSAYAIGSKVVVKVYDSTGSTLLAESAASSYAGSGSPVSFGNLFFTPASAATDTTLPDAPTGVVATQNSVYVTTAKAGQTITVKKLGTDGTTETTIATATSTGTSQAVYFPKITTVGTTVLKVYVSNANGSSDAVIAYVDVASSSSTNTTTGTAHTPTMAVRQLNFTFEAGKEVEIDFKNKLGVMDPDGDYVRFSADFPFFGMFMDVDGTFHGSPAQGTWNGKVKACDIYNNCVSSDNITFQINAPTTGTTTGNNFVSLPITYGASLSATDIASKLASGLTLFEPNGSNGYTKIVITPSSQSGGSVVVTDYGYDVTSGSFTPTAPQNATFTIDNSGKITVSMGTEGGSGEFAITKAAKMSMNGTSAIEYMTSWKQTVVGSAEEWEAQSEWNTYLAQSGIDTIAEFKDSVSSSGAVVGSNTVKNWLWSPSGPRVLGTNGVVYPAQIVYDANGNQSLGNIGTTAISGASWGLNGDILTVTFDGGLVNKFKFANLEGTITPMLYAVYKDPVGATMTMSAYGVDSTTTPTSEQLTAVEGLAKQIVKMFYSASHSTNSGSETSSSGYIPADSELFTLTESNIANMQFTVDMNGGVGTVQFVSTATSKNYYIKSPSYNETGTWSIVNGKVAFTRPGANDYYVAVATDMVHGYKQEGANKYPVTFIGSPTSITSSTNMAPFMINNAQVNLVQGSAGSVDLKTYFGDDQGVNGLGFSAASYIPTGFTLSGTVLNASSTLAAGVYNISIKACDSSSLCTNGNISVNIASQSSLSNFPQIPSLTGITNPVKP